MFFKRYKILRLGGFDVNVDISWIFISILIIWSLAAAFFPTRYPGLDGSIYIGMAAIAAFGFFSSIVIHEYCHSVVARHFGMKMEGITLWFLGGVASMSEDPPSAKAEFLMAGAGPVASISIACACFLAAQAAASQDWPVVATGVFDYLWRINLILVVFNLIPAFPLDGGRLLRAALWGWKGQMRWATRLASRIGGGFGAILMILGLFSAFTGGGIGGFWYFLIGLFIRLAAQSSYTQLLVKETLADVPLGRLIKEPPVSVPSHESVASLVEDYFRRYQHGFFPVVDSKNEFLGCLRSRDIRDIPKEKWSTLRAADIMKPCPAIASDADAYSSMQRMQRERADHCIVLNQTRVAGVVSLTDILRFVSMRLDLNSDMEEKSGSARHRDASEGNAA